MMQHKKRKRKKRKRKRKKRNKQEKRKIKRLVFLWQENQKVFWQMFLRQKVLVRISCDSSKRISAKSGARCNGGC